MNPAHPDATTHALLAALLEQGRAVHLLSGALTAVSLAGLGLAAAFPSGFLFPAILAGAVLLGAAETYLAVRVGFDAAIFRLKAAGETGWPDVDRGLSALHLVARERLQRSDESRAEGALRLFRRQGSAAASQGLLVLTAFAAQAWLARTG